METLGARAAPVDCVGVGLPPGAWGGRTGARNEVPGAATAMPRTAPVAGTYWYRVVNVVA